MEITLPKREQIQTFRRMVPLERSKVIVLTLLGLVPAPVSAPSLQSSLGIRSLQMEPDVLR